MVFVLLSLAGCGGVLSVMTGIVAQMASLAKRLQIVVAAILGIVIQMCHSENDFAFRPFRRLAVALAAPARAGRCSMQAALTSAFALTARPLADPQRDGFPV